jgi:multicomponent K+:H+ antiporter subunit A
VPHEPPRWMRFPIELLVLACVLVGVLPGLTIGPLLNVAVHALLGPHAPSYSLVVWHGFTTPLIMSLVALGGGGLLYLVLQKTLARGDEHTPLLPPIEGRRIFDRALAVLSWRWARALEGLLGTRRLQAQLSLLVLAALVAGGWPILARGLAWGPLPLTAADPAFVLMWIVGAVCALGAAWQAKFHRLVALVLAGGAGLVVCLTFVWLSAPDLALTQLLVEVVTTVLLLLGLRWLPKRTPFKWTLAGARAALPRRGRDLALSVAAGTALSVLAYAVMSRPLPDSISRFFIEGAWPEGGGTNVVNVIIVDFRGFDTLGEITVLATVAITVYSLLRRFRPARESIEPLPQWIQQSEKSVSEDLIVPAVIMRAMFPPIALLAIYLLLRGHNLPGGGFVAGITLAIGVILQYMAGGTRWTEDRLVLHPARWIAAGLVLATGTGAGSLLFDHPFLTSHFMHVDLPVLGSLHVPTAFFFDLGVFLLVVGATGLILIALAHQSARGHRPAPARDAAPAGGN